MNYYLYILYSNKADKFYIGYTTNPEKRLFDHNGGKNRFTRVYRPWRLVYQESFNDKTEAIKREKQLKNWKSRKQIEKLINIPGWRSGISRGS